MKKYELWKERIEDYRKSNLKAHEWCEKNNLPLTTLRYWITKFNREKIISAKEANQPNNFIDVTPTVLTNNHTEPIIINFKKLSITVSEGFDRTTLRNILEAIGAYD